MKKNIKKFFYELVSEMDMNEGKIDSEHPECPHCGEKMNFYGHDEHGDFDYGEGYWECSSCGYKFTENDLSSTYDDYWSKN